MLTGVAHLMIRFMPMSMVDLPAKIYDLVLEMDSFAISKGMTNTDVIEMIRGYMLIMLAMRCMECDLPSLSSYILLSILMHKVVNQKGVIL